MKKTLGSSGSSRLTGSTGSTASTVSAPKKIVPRRYSIGKTNEKSTEATINEEIDDLDDDKQLEKAIKGLELINLFCNNASNDPENVIIWTGGNTNALMSHLKLVGDHLNSTNPVVHVAPSLSSVLEFKKYKRYTKIFLCPGPHEVPNDMGVGDDYTIVSPTGDATFTCSSPRPTLAATGNQVLHSVTFDSSKCSTALAVISGCVEANFCLFVAEAAKTQVQAQAAVVYHDTEIILKNCTIGGFSTGIIAHAGSNVRLEDCTLTGCSVALQVYEGATVSLVRCRIKEFGQAAIIYETSGELDPVGEGNNSLSGCKDISITKCKFFRKGDNYAFLARVDGDHTPPQLA